MTRAAAIEGRPAPSRWRHRFALFTAAATLFLIFAGGMVTSTGSGLAVPDWPLSYGKVFPEEFTEGMRGIGLVRGVFYEHGHRMIAATVGLLTVLLAVWTWRAERRRWVRRLAAFAVAAVVLQGVLGGVTVLLHLPAGVSISHAGLANLFFCLTVTLAAVTGPWWLGRPAAPAPDAPGLFRVAAWATGAVYLQILLGAVMRHFHAGTAIPDFPLAFGRLVPPLGDPRVAIHFAHRLGAVLVLAMVAAVLLRAFRVHRGDASVLGPVLLLGAVALLQATLGAFTVWTMRSVPVTTLHVAGGSATLAAALLVALRAGRTELRTAERPGRAGALDAAGARA